MCMNFEDAILPFGNGNDDGSPNLEAWRYFKKMYHSMSSSERLYNQLRHIYTHYPYDLEEFYSFLKDSLDNETNAERQKRIDGNRKALHDYLDDGDFLKLFRGVNDYSLPIECALSYTLDRKVAEFFSNRRLSENAELIETAFHINDIILYTNCRNEKEVIVIPECLDCLDWYFG